MLDVRFRPLIGRNFQPSNFLTFNRPGGKRQADSTLIGGYLYVNNYCFSHPNFNP